MSCESSIAGAKANASVAAAERMRESLIRTYLLEVLCLDFGISEAGLAAEAKTLVFARDPSGNEYIVHRTTSTERRIPVALVLDFALALNRGTTLLRQAWLRKLSVTNSHKG